MMQPITTITNAVRVIDMVLHCPACGLQHIDEATAAWPNPPHRSHLCHGCGHVWRPADVPTNGVKAVKTKGQRDRAPVDPRDVFGTRILADGALDAAASAVEGSADVWTGFARNDARVCIRAALAHGAAARIDADQPAGADRAPPDVRPGAQFMVEMDSALRHAEAFDNGRIATSVVRRTILAYQAKVVPGAEGTVPGTAP